MLLERSRQLRADCTEAEALLWSRLRGHRLNGLKFRRQVAFSGSYIADFVHSKSKLIVEIDGSQHAEQKAYDERRTRFFEREGYRVLRFWNNQVTGELENVLETIYRAATDPLPGAARLSLSPEGEGI